jgi:hypothetical protein
MHVDGEQHEIQWEGTSGAISHTKKHLQHMYLCCAALYSTCTSLYCTVLFCTAHVLCKLCCSLQYMYLTLLHCTVLYSTCTCAVLLFTVHVPHSTVLYCSVQHMYSTCISLSCIVNHFNYMSSYFSRKQRQDPQTGLKTVV